MTESRTHHHRSPARRLLALAGTLSFLWSAPGAVAQGFYVGGGFYGYEQLPPISPRSVAYRLQDRGFTEIGRPRFDGEAYVVDATNQVGTRVRLFVGARDGAVIGRQRLDAPYYPSARPVRPGYGWTEEDLQPRRTARAGEGLIPPGNVPDVARAPRASASPVPDTGRALPSRAVTTDANPLGVNPDAKVSAEAKPRAAPPRRTARLSEPQKPAAPRVAPAAPAAPKPGTADKAKPIAGPDTKSAVVEPPPTAAPTPAAEAPAPDRSASDKPAVEAPKIADAPRKEETWHDPPASERNVRVIEGATVVPGDSQQPSTN